MKVGAILRDFLMSYRMEHAMPLYQLKVTSALTACRTKQLGGHLNRCEECGYEAPRYNSCRNRHCPQCGYLYKERWLMSRKAQLLPVTYFHCVFTLPEELNPLMLVNQRVGYNLLFRSASETLLELGGDPKHLGAEIGIIAMLHSWGQNLMDHPHLHCIMPGGGLSEDGKHWRYPKKTKQGDSFFVHVNVISDLFRKKFLFYLKEAGRKGELQFPGQTNYLKSAQSFRKLINVLYKKKWVTYCKETFEGGEGGLKYLAKYVHKSAISNSRIIRVEDGEVWFKWRDYRDGKEKVMHLSITEFIRRLLLHILPPNFCRIRYYGILSSRNLKTKLMRCMTLLSRKISNPKDALTWQELLFRLTGVDINICPKCGKGRMMHLPLNHSPP